MKAEREKRLEKENIIKGEVSQKTERMMNHFEGANPISLLFFLSTILVNGSIGTY